MTPTRKTRREARRLFHRCLVGGVLDEARTGQVAHQIVSSGRRGSRPILYDFLRLVRLEVDRHTAVVESAAPLAPDVREGVRAGLTSAYGHGLKTSFALNTGLIGGMRIKVGSDVFDGSVRA